MYNVERKRLTKAERLAVYNKYDGRCAYCGDKIELKDMQADHIYSVFRADWNGNASTKEINAIENFNPACRSCNYYKSVYGIDAFKNNIKTMLWANIRRTFAYRFLIKYKLIIENDHEITFLCEEKEQQ